MWHRYLFAFIFIYGFHLYLIYSVLKHRTDNRTVWLFFVMHRVLFVAIMHFLWVWDVTGVYTRYILLFAFLLAVFVSYRHNRPNWVTLSASRRYVQSNIAASFVYLGLLAYVVPGVFYPREQAIDLTFPFDDGAYHVGNGGNNALLNPHNPVEAQQYAVDMTKLNALGMRANGVYPSDVNRYAMFAEPLYSPCDAEVMTVVDNLPDLAPPEVDEVNLPGNYVIVACEGALVLMAHLQQDGVVVEVGDFVETGQLLAHVGNSGDSSEPHVHIHAVSAESGDVFTGVGVPIKFDGRFLLRNTVVRQ